MSSAKFYLTQDGPSRNSKFAFSLEAFNDVYLSLEIVVFRNDLFKFPQNPLLKTRVIRFVSFIIHTRNGGKHVSKNLIQF